MSPTENSVDLHSKNDDVNSEIGAPKKRQTSPQERQQIIEELRLIPKRMCISRNY